MEDQRPERLVYPPDTQIDQWIIKDHIGHGGYGEIYEVSSPDFPTPAAMKVEPKNATKQGMADEIIFLSYLQDSPYFPRFIAQGETEDIRYFVMELLGPSLSVVRRWMPQRRFTPHTATVVAREMLLAITELHNRGFVHRDIKPGNFLFRNDPSHMVCLIDFGLSMLYRDLDTGLLLKEREQPGFVGTCSFASLNAHAGRELGRRDDIISWLYSVIDLAEAGLPWPGSKDREQTIQLKESLTIEQLCGCLPRQFVRIFEGTMRLQFSEEPESRRYLALLNRAVNELGGEDAPFDWELQDEVMESCPGLPRRPRREEIEESYTVSDEEFCESPRRVSVSTESTPPRKDIWEQEMKAEPVEEAAKPEQTAPVQKKRVKKAKNDLESEPVCQLCGVY
jgi:serine/threonine protein kinase